MDDSSMTLLKATTSAWVLKSLPLVKEGSSVSIHVDDLLGQAHSWTESDGCRSVESGLRAFEVIAGMNIDLAQYTPSLAVVLDPSDTLDVVGVEWTALQQTPVFTPPEIYLLARGSRIRSGEEYTREIAPPSLLKAGGPVPRLWSYYRCHRTHEDAGRGWEYVRSLHLELHPV